MKRIIQYTLTGLILLASASCVTEFFPEIDEYKELLVVEGQITDENKTHYVRLSSTTPVGVQQPSPMVTGAMVMIYDDQGNEFLLNEVKPGVYATDSTEFVAQTGHYYSLRVMTPEDNYESDAMELKPAPQIDSIYSEFVEGEPTAAGPSKGHQLYFDASDPSGQTDYTRYTYTETWEVILPFDYMPHSKRHCWNTEESDHIIVRDASTSNNNSFVKEPLLYLSTYEKKVAVKYSVELKQYAISQEEYRYWESLRNVNEEVGGLYDPVPAPMSSNMRSETQPEKDVLGFFSVAGVNTKRFFMEKDSLERPLYHYCVTDTLYTLGNPLIGRTIWVLQEHQPPDSPIFWTASKYNGCADCTISGTNVKPDFWDDDQLK